MDLNHRPPGPEPQETKSKLLNWLELPCATLSLTALPFATRRTATSQNAFLRSNEHITVSHSIESPRVMSYLTKPSEAEIQMIHPSKVYASKSSIPKVSAKAAAIAALASNQDNQK
jgi:hypothetical protein